MARAKSGRIGLPSAGRAGFWYLAATLALTFPLCWSPSTMGPFDRVDALENAWTLSWVGHQIVNKPWDLFEAGTFHPLAHSLAFSEPLFVPSLFASPLLLMTRDLVLTYNLVLLFAVWSSAFGMYLLSVSLTRNRLAATLGGLFYGFVPYRFARFHLLQLQFFGFLPLILLSIDRWQRTGRGRWAWALAGLLVLQALSGSHLAVMAAVSVLIALVTLVGRRIVGTGAALVLAAASVCALAGPYRDTRPFLDGGWEGQPLEAESVDAEMFLRSPSRLYGHWSGATLEDSPLPRLFPGFSLLFAGAFGALILLRRRGGFHRPWPNLACYGLLLATGVALTLGPRIPLYRRASRHAYFLVDLGSSTHFGLLIVLGLCVLASFALAWLFDASPFRDRRNPIAVTIAAFFLVESTVAPLKLTPLRDEPPEVYSWLAEKAGPGAIAELPFEARQPHRLFRARHHRFRPTIGGAGRFVPEPHRWMELLLRRFPSRDSMVLLKSLGVRYVIIHLESYTPHNRLRLLNDLTRYRSFLVPVRDFGSDLVFEVPRAEPPGPPPPGRSIARIAAPTLAPISQSGTPSYVEHALVLGSRSRVSGLRLHYPPHPRVPVQRILLYVPGKEGAREAIRTTAPEWPAWTEFITGLLENPLDPIQEVRFEPFDAAEVRIRLEGRGLPPRVREIELLGSSSPN